MSGKTVTHAAKPDSSSITTQAHSSVFRREVDKQAENPLQQTIWQPSLPGAVSRPLPLTNPGYNFANIPVLAPTPNNVQAKLTVGEANDKYEQEADRIADTVMRMPEPTQQGRSEDNDDEGTQNKPYTKPLIQRQEQAEEEDEHSPVQAKAAGSKTPKVNSEQEDYIINSIRGQGQPLSSGERDFF